MSVNTTLAEELLPGYSIKRGSIIDRAMLIRFMHLTYQDMFPTQDFSHLAQTVKQYFSDNTPLWWVEEEGGQGEEDTETPRRGDAEKFSPFHSSTSPVGCLWMGNAIDQVSGDRHAHIFLIYVVPEYRRRGIGTALMQYAEAWAKKRGDRQIGLQVFPSNQAALNLYNQLGYQTQSFWMLKPLYPKI
ncbi:GNAT family N-acetyltransferase [Chlorogloeopsis sp. ULAP01]|uniref:GNAT family N-acetyltransferase n=1 Tax=Chlorogloeopsis sp. ULAP01 TaxID=3056483 RepID=UPI0025AAF339|nr:GNAT family N-acetyltransferase [Chlorogloeopsis sp. ULAP01]MDM9382524.1 GNAT family N-acetyltransferase [Chlorogloeopsis sp. ULAP01]